MSGRVCYQNATARTKGHECFRMLGSRAQLVRALPAGYTRTHRYCRRPSVQPVKSYVREESSGLPENGFEKDTTSMVLRLLTVRAVQQVVVQLQEFNQLQAQYINNYAAENGASDGNQFIAKLLKQPMIEVLDPVTRSIHTIDPQTLAHRILQVREELARSVGASLSACAAHENTTVLRSHLSASLKQH